MRQGHSQLRHVLEDHVWAPDRQHAGAGEGRARPEGEGSIGDPRRRATVSLLTDVVIEAKQRAAEFCVVDGERDPARAVSPEPICGGRGSVILLHLPLSPFITTHIREPTHLSMSSRRGQDCQPRCFQTRGAGGTVPRGRSCEVEGAAMVWIFAVARGEDEQFGPRRERCMNKAD